MPSHHLQPREMQWSTRSGLESDRQGLRGRFTPIEVNFLAGGKESRK